MPRSSEQDSLASADRTEPPAGILKKEQHPRPVSSSNASLSVHMSVPDDSFSLDRQDQDETEALIPSQQSRSSGYGSINRSTPRQALLSRSQSFRSRQASRRGSFTRVRTAASSSSYVNIHDSVRQIRSVFYDDRTWYDQYTTTDWIRDARADSVRVKELRARKDVRGRVQAFFDGAQGWLLVAIVGCITAAVAYTIDVTETVVFDYKSGYCAAGWWRSRRSCCAGSDICDAWNSWSGLAEQDEGWVDFAAFVCWVVFLAMAACLVTLGTKTNISSHVPISTLDENLGAMPRSKKSGNDEDESDNEAIRTARKAGPTKYYPAAGSGVAEVKVILSGFVLHGYLGLRTLLFKSVGLVLSVASGMSVGKEGPLVHIATCIGNICSRMFVKYGRNDAKRREILSASAASGVAVAFGAPIGGVLFSLEEVSYYFPPKTLFRTFLCCIVAALSLKFLNPYGTGKIVLFQVRYLTDWQTIELGVFASLGIIGGVAGALFIKACRLWAITFRRIRWIKASPPLEVFLVALVTGVVGYWNRYTRLPVAELLYELAAPCDSFSEHGHGLCPTRDRIPHILAYLSWALVIKALLTIVTFGIKVPAGIYVPSMVVGGLIGRIVGHSLQYLTLEYDSFAVFVGCTPSNGNPESCIVPGVYALVAAGATMCGVTRLSVTLAVILFELTGSLDHVLPFSLGVMFAKWTADALEPYSIYDLLTDMNGYPYLDSKARPMFTNDLRDITSRLDDLGYIDVSESPYIKSADLRRKLHHLHRSGELDGGFPIVEHGTLIGLISAPELECALDELDDEDGDVQCRLHPHNRISPRLEPRRFSDDSELAVSKADLTGQVDLAPLALDLCSPMDLVFECFVKLGLRYVCVLQNGKFVGMVHKKTFVKYVKDVEDGNRKLERGWI